MGARLLGIAGAIVLGVDFKGEDLVVRVRVDRRSRRGCGICARRSPVYDQGRGLRRWRALDLGWRRCSLEAAAPRVRCPVHGVVVAQVPWAERGARSTRSFDDRVA